METLEQLKEIERKADAGGYTQINLNGDSFYRFDGQNWIVYDGDEIECIEYEMPATRSLSDIKRIIELMEGKKKAYQAYVALEEIKQKYNGENKIAKEFLKLAYECDEFALSGDLRKGIKEFLGGL